MKGDNAAKGYVILGILIISVCLLISSVAKNALKGKITPPSAAAVSDTVSVTDTIPAVDSTGEPEEQPEQSPIWGGAM